MAKKKPDEKAEKSGFVAETKFLWASPHKIRPVADLVRRKSYTEAIAVLEHMPHKGAKLLRKTVKSAAGNALERNKKLDEDMLYIKDVQINDGPRVKRLWIRGRGRADMLLKRMCHITVVIDEAGK